MPLRLDVAAPDFARAFDALVEGRRESAASVDADAAAILAAVAAEGDAAVLRYTAKFDRLNLTAAQLRVPERDIDAALDAQPADLRSALETAAQRIAAFHEGQMPSDRRYTDAMGVELGERWTPIATVGIYVPGGLAAYPSSVLMNALPARVAGVDRVVMVVPTPDGALNPLVLAAAKLAGVREIYRIGGAQAVGALAYGTATVPRVDKIVGPGNAWVAAAKRQVFGRVGIDSIAGPSEILVVADRDNDPAWIAADLLSQAEHDPVAQAILITDDASFGDKVAAAADVHLARLPRESIAAASWRDHGAIVRIARLADAAPLIDRLAPEHLELALADPEPLAAEVRHAGAIFLGRHTPEAIGDYVAGPNHVLPTNRSARFSSGLSVFDFLKRSTLVRCDAQSLARIGPAAIRLAQAEGLDAHALSVAIRLDATR
jgi:histidinol dehydrogenase